MYVVDDASVCNYVYNCVCVCVFMCVFMYVCVYVIVCVYPTLLFSLYERIASRKRVKKLDKPGHLYKYCSTVVIMLTLMMMVKTIKMTDA